MSLERLVPATELFATFRQSVLAPDTDAEALIRELCADAKVMRSFDTPLPRTPEAEFFVRLSALDAGTVLPIVLLLFRSPEVTEEQRRRGLRILESWLARRALMRLTAKNYNRLVPRLVARMKADIEHADDALLQALSGAEGEISRWPGDAEFTDFLRTREVYGTVSQPRLVMALAAAEASLYTNKTDVPVLADDLSLEHLIPQEWETHWPLTDADGRALEGEALEQASVERWGCLNRLGNLTIVTQPLNAAMSHSAWEKKRAELNRYSKLLLNAKLAERDSWDEQAIDERGSWLAQRLAIIWPGPELENW
ncbi:MAG: HNH endonuclease family protein [Streptosporangiaceae bacterium]